MGKFNVYLVNHFKKNSGSAFELSAHSFDQAGTNFHIFDA